ncbi:hypothetical protein CR513_29581, partial [Mucuna pruriens]
GSCVNVANERLVKQLALPTIVHPTSYRLQGLNEKGELLVDKQTKVMLTLGGFRNRLVCDVVPMEAKHLLLGRHWQFGKKVIQDRITNSERKFDAKLNKKENKSEVEKRKERGKEKVGEKSKSVRRFLLAKREPLFTLPTDMPLHVSPSLNALPVGMQNFLEEFQHVFLEDVVTLRGIEHHIDLRHEATLPNRTAYRMNSEEVKEIQKQVGKLLEKVWVRETMSPCVIPIILVPKNMALRGCALIVDQ